MSPGDLARIQWQQEAEPGEKSGGIFMFGMSNDVIRNRVVGHEHGEFSSIFFYFPQPPSHFTSSCTLSPPWPGLWSLGSGQPNGRPMGMSMGMVCNQFMPYGKVASKLCPDLCLRSKGTCSMTARSLDSTWTTSGRGRWGGGGHGPGSHQL